MSNRRLDVLASVASRQPRKVNPQRLTTLQVIETNLQCLLYYKAMVDASLNVYLKAVYELLLTSIQDICARYQGMDDHDLLVFAKVTTAAIALLRVQPI